MYQDQHAGQKHYIKISNNYLESVEQFRYLRTNLTNQNSIHEEIKSRLKSGNACYHSARTFAFQFSTLKYTNKSIEKFNYACFVVWV
jgi:hypothetical protein